ncbi:MAG TPA: efflux RND transporter periplasmic adaptor subunit [Planctomycetaceae bacterium]|nr:efflux RND transporter periplasmic adaptor subunit [Planctomycetaceae bacterium]
MSKLPHFPWRAARTVVAAFVVLAVIGASWRWWPQVSGWVHQIVQSRRTTTSLDYHDHAHAEGPGAHDHGGHSHAHEESNSLELSQQARRNLGLTAEYVRPVKLQSFQRTITVPAVIVERPGRTNIKVATPLTGVVEHVHAVTGEVVEPGSLLFEIRLTHEELVQTQTDFLRIVGELDIENREIKRLTELTKNGAVSGKTLLDREYSKEKLEARLKAEREALRLHGLSDAQIDAIAESRHLLGELRIVVPSPDAHGQKEQLRLTNAKVQRVSMADGKPERSQRLPLVIEELDVHKGQSVAAGDQLCSVADYSRLYIEGKAFEQDSAVLSRALKNGWALTAVFNEEQSHYERAGLKLAYIANAVDPVARSLSFFVNLPNEIVQDETNDEGQRFVSWRYRVGERLELRVPVEEWPQQLIVPVDAVAREGAESYVFQENGDHFDRVPVHVKYRDQKSVVIANDGSLYPGDVIAMRGAHQLQMALKNKAGGGVDPHAGHNH